MVERVKRKTMAGRYWTKKFRWQDQAGYIHNVFTISKQNICAEVNMNAGFLTVNLINPDGRFLKAHNAIVANMKILAQIHLGKFRTLDTDAILTEYFTRNGWTVGL